MRSTIPARRAHGPALVLACALTATACGGGGGSPGTSPFGSEPGTSTAPVAPVTPVTPSTPLQPSATYAQRCAPDNPLAAAPRTGSLAIEKQWIRAYLDEAYLWNQEVPVVDANAAAYSGSDVATALQRYFDALLTPQLTSTGSPRDRFSFIMPTREWDALAGSAEHVGYGLEWSLGSATPPRRIRIAYTEPGGTAQSYQLRRGDELVSVDGVSADAGDAAGVRVLNEALYPGSRGSVHSFVFRRSDGSTVYASMASGVAASTPVLRSEVIAAADGKRVGHLVFNDHLVPAEAQLIRAITDFKAQGISDLVLDLRYNGGGYLYIASELAYMIAGPQRVASRPFERLVFNARRSAENEATPFYASSCHLDSSSGRCTSQQPLPTLNLPRVYVLTQGGTCSASESVINGLLGVDVEVIQIGGTTCGKPYGFSAKDNCGNSYFPIEFSGVNAKGFGDYADGFTPAATSSGRQVRGCSIDDDLDHALGDPAERMLAAALHHRTTGACLAPRLAKAQAAVRGEGLALQPLRAPARSNKVRLAPR